MTILCLPSTTFQNDPERNDTSFESLDLLMNQEKNTSLTPLVDRNTHSNMCYLRKANDCGLFR